MFKPVDPKADLAKLEHSQIEYWKKHKIFHKSVENRKGKKKFVIFDGPPFANGLPHYGHILAQALKDAVTRFAVMRGHYVPRVNGWDCHGLPVEYEIEKNLELSGRKDIETMGVEKFNAACRESVFTYTQEWAWLFDRMARWVDTENGYATLDAPYMESIWWVFKQIWEKDLLYKGYKSMHLCPRCATPLSNFEVSQGYKEVTDLSVTAMFRSKKDPNRYFLAWTTTPWSLPGNAALAVGPSITYVEVERDGQTFILAKDQLANYFELENLSIEREFKGKELIGETYEPLFNSYLDSKLEGIDLSWRVFAGDFVTTDTGTGIVHIAGGFGEDDMNLCLREGLPILKHVTVDGLFASEVKEFAGKFVKGQDHNIAEWMEGQGLLFKKENIRHSYPHCWRCDTPLLNYAMEAWFVRVSELKDRLLKNNEKIHWQPEHIKEGRFGKWLENVRDWNISRNRFWGTPLPVWECESCENSVCIGSTEELKERAGHLPMRDGELDLHRPYIDEITFPCLACKGTMKRIPEVLDCWFESGAMPYAQMHYPFENQEEFKANFPADAIAEGLDQTRGWFYTLHVLSTILFDEPAFKNVIVNGILLAADGEKLSKRKKNYPDPKALFESKGVDTTRMFLYNSTAPVGEDVRFSEQHVDDLLKKFTLTLWNSYSFLVTYANLDKIQAQSIQSLPQHKLDQWILSELHQLIKEVTVQMEDYNLSKATRPFIEFVDNLSNWYLRRSRRRFWKSESDQDKKEAYDTLYTVLVTLSKLLAPFMPFLSEEIFRNLTGEESVHLQDWPEFNEDFISETLNDEMKWIRTVVTLGHAIRGKQKIKVRQPLQKVKVGLPASLEKSLLIKEQDIILEELNVKELEILEKASDLAIQVALPNAKKIGPKFGADVQKIISEAKTGNFKVLSSGQIEVAGFILEADEVEIAYKGKDEEIVESSGGMAVSLDLEITEELRQEGYAREVIRFIQDLRKEAGYEVSDRIQVLVLSEGDLEQAIEHFADTISQETLATEISQKGSLESDAEKETSLDGFKLKIAVKKSS